MRSEHNDKYTQLLALTLILGLLHFISCFVCLCLVSTLNSSNLVVAASYLMYRHQSSPLIVWSCCTSRWVSLCASKLWICLAMEPNTSWKSAPSISSSSSHWSGSTMRGSWVTCSKASASGLCDKINVSLGNPDRKWRIQTVGSLCEYQAEMHVWTTETHYFCLVSLSKRSLTNVLKN